MSTPVATVTLEPSSRKRQWAVRVERPDGRSLIVMDASRGARWAIGIDVPASRRASA